VGLVDASTDPDSGKKTYAYDPHLDPQLVWAGKAEHTSFEVPTVSLHVHERIDPRTIIEAVQKRNNQQEGQQLALFETPQENPPLRQAIEFYKHRHNWSNRLIAGDSLLVMNSLLEKEGMGGQVQMVYIDPPYGIRYRSNFQPFVNRHNVAEADKDEDLSQEPEMLCAFRDTWEVGIHSYLTYLRDRLLLTRELLHESGSVFVQISDENVHLVRNLMDEVLGVDNFVAQIYFQTTTGRQQAHIDRVGNYLVWYSKSIEHLKYRNLFLEKGNVEDGSVSYGDLQSQGVRTTGSYEVKFEGRVYRPLPGNHWKVTEAGMNQLIAHRRVAALRTVLRYMRYDSDFPLVSLRDVWTDVSGGAGRDKIYVVQTGTSLLQRCILMTTDPGDLVFDPTCGSGTTAHVAEQWGRRWITCDTSRVSTTLTKQRLMTSSFNYYELAQPQEGVGSGFKYKTVPHITLKSLANNEPPKDETLYDQPVIDRTKARVTGPFTLEAVPSPVVSPLVEGDVDLPADESISRSGETSRQRDWRDELLQVGIRGKGGQRIEFSRVEPLSGTRCLHADAETKGNNPERVVVSFGPEHSLLEQRQVELAIEEARTLVPRPKFVVFAAFEFDPEAAKDIDETNWPGVTLLKSKMNADLLTEDLKKKRASNDSFWLIGQPDVELRKIASGEDKGKWHVEVCGFDYFDTRKGDLVSGGVANIAMWLLDTDYDGRSLYPRQVFFPMAGERDGWSRLSKSLKAEIDEGLLEAYRGSLSLPFTSGPHQQVAVKIVDDRGIESLKVMEVA
jgi:adenine-specific DNA-methyltransferase